MLCQIPQPPTSGQDDSSRTHGDFWAAVQPSKAAHLCAWGRGVGRLLAGGEILPLAGDPDPARRTARQGRHLGTWQDGRSCLRRILGDGGSLMFRRPSADASRVRPGSAGVVCSPPDAPGVDGRSASVLEARLALLSCRGIDLAPLRRWRRCLRSPPNGTNLRRVGGWGAAVRERPQVCLLVGALRCFLFGWSIGRGAAVAVAATAKLRSYAPVLRLPPGPDPVRVWSSSARAWV